MRRSILPRPQSKLAAGVLLAGFAIAGLFAQTATKAVKDQQEYDLFTGATKETDLTKRVTLLSTWKDKYPESDFKVDRLLLFGEAYQKLGQGEKMFTSARELLTLSPNNSFGLLWVTLLTASTQDKSAERLDYGEKITNQFLSRVDAIATELKAPRQDLEVQARRTLVFIHDARKDYKSLEEEILRIFKVNPNSGNLSFQLGSAILSNTKDKTPQRQIQALYHFARAANYTGGDALTDQSRREMQAYLEKQYTNYHGGKDGLQELIDLAMKNALPPNDLEIKSRQQVELEAEEKLAKENPMLAQFLQVKRELEGDGGQTYFDAAMKGAGLPKWKGKVVSSTPSARPREVLVAVSGTAAEIKLRVITPMPSAIEDGAEIEFEGVGAEYIKSPFLITVDIEKDKIYGWPGTARGGTKAGQKQKGK